MELNDNEKNCWVDIIEDAQIQEGVEHPYCVSKLGIPGIPLKYIMGVDDALDNIRVNGSKSWLPTPIKA